MTIIVQEDRIEMVINIAQRFSKKVEDITAAALFTATVLQEMYRVDQQCCLAEIVWRSRGDSLDFLAKSTVIGFQSYIQFSS